MVTINCFFTPPTYLAAFRPIISLTTPFMRYNTKKDRHFGSQTNDSSFEQKQSQLDLLINTMRYLATLFQYLHWNWIEPPLHLELFSYWRAPINNQNIGRSWLLERANIICFKTHTEFYLWSLAFLSRRKSSMFSNFFLIMIQFVLVLRLFYLRVTMNLCFAKCKGLLLVL